MKLFEDNRPPQDAAALVLALLREFKEVPSSVASQAISPSGLACQVACALKLQGIPTEPQKESFQSKCFTDCGEDRHKRIQAFLSKTPYWVDVEKYVTERNLPVRVITAQERVTKNRQRNITRLEELKKMWAAIPADMSGSPEVKEALKEIDFLEKWLQVDDATHCKELHDEDPYECLLQHKELPIRFKCDGMLLIEGVYYILEIKTERGSVNAFRTSYDPKHQKQGITYTLMLGTNKILWLYEGREMLEQKPFVQVVTKDEQAEMLKYLKQIVENKDAIENLSKDEKSCAYCPYKKYCRAYFKELKKKEKENGRS